MLRLGRLVLQLTRYRLSRHLHPPQELLLAALVLPGQA
jgi:hypothetical protein